MIQLIAHDALSALINLTNSSIISIRLAKIPGFLDGLVRMIIVSLVISSVIILSSTNDAVPYFYARMKPHYYQTWRPCYSPTCQK